MPKIMKSGIEYSGGGGDNSVEISYADYNALSDAERNNGTIYYITDVESTDTTTIIDTMEEIEANEEENKIAGALAVKEVIEHLKLKLLWENSAPTTSFAAQTINLASDDYDYLEIYFITGATGASANLIKCEKCLKGYGTTLTVPSSYDSDAMNMIRTLTYVSDTQLSANSTVCSYSAVTNTDAYIIPYKIYGGKF